MTAGDVLVLGMTAVCAVGVVVGIRRDRLAGQRQFRADVPVSRVWIAGGLTLAFGLVMGTFGVWSLLEPGTTVVSSGRLRGAEVHHRSFGVLSLGIAAVAGWVLAETAKEIRRRAGESQPAPKPAPKEIRSVPTVDEARSAWSRSIAAGDLDGLAAAARHLAGALLREAPGSATTTELVARLPPALAEPMQVLLTELDRARYAGGTPDLGALDVCFEAVVDAR